MKLRVENFGPIREADVDLRPLTVFVGPSNTGKSYLAILLYSVAKMLEEDDERAYFTLRGAIRRLLAKKQENSLSLPPAVEDEELARIVEQAFPMYGETVSKLWQAEAERCFGEEWEKILKKNGAANCSVTIESGDGDVALNLTRSGEDKLPAVAPLLEKSKKILRSIGDEHDAREVVYYWSRAIAPLIAREFNFLPRQPRQDRRWRRMSGNGVHYLPAVRGGVMQSHRTLVSALVKGASKIGITGAAIIPFTAVLGDFLDKLINIEDTHPRHMLHRGQKPLPSKLPGDIEKIMGGEIKIERSETEYPDFRYAFRDRNKKARDMPLMSASSAVSELAPIVLFMRHYLSPGDIFIVEEPEAHLHPAAQRDIAEVLARLVNAGVNVVVTTHSNVILGQLSNFIHADNVPEAKILKKKGEKRTINEDKVAIYSFADSRPGRGTAVREIPFDKETGMLTRDHLNVESDMLNEYAHILDRKGNA